MMKTFFAVIVLLGAFAALGSAAVVKPKDVKDVLVQNGEDPDLDIRMRRDLVKQMAKDAWDDYVRFAWGENELQPISERGGDGGIFGNSKIGATIVDSLGTLYIMGLTEEYEKARDFVATNLTFRGVDATVSLFETNIRFIGGLLSAYAMTQDQLYVEKTIEIAELLLPAFDTPTGFPHRFINLKTGQVQPGNSNGPAEWGTLHLELMYLSEVSGDNRFRDVAMKIREAIKRLDKPNGLYYTENSIVTGEWLNSHVSIGAMADSFYEYLIKSAIQLNDAEARQLYDDAMDGFFNNGLVKSSQPSHLMYVAESNNGQVNDMFSHLACFAGGMFALGAAVDPLNKNAARDMEAGRNITNTCHESYVRTHTRIGSEVFRFNDQVEAKGQTDGDKHYNLRPEVIESYFYLYRITGERKYRDWAWDATLAIQRHTKVAPGRGYSGIGNVDLPDSEFDDHQQTFLLAEVFKYLYLIFSTDNLIDLSQWVFNTEAHPLPIKATNPRW